MTPHSIFEFIGGDDWEIQATLLDEYDNPYDLTGATVKWTLADSLGKSVLGEGDSIISVTNALAGICSVVVPAAKTTTVVSGLYHDALRIVIGGITSTLAMGPVGVTTDPWMAQTEVARKPGTTRIPLRVIG